MTDIKIESSVIGVERDAVIHPTYEIVCPFCKHKILFEVELLKSCSNLFCTFCHQKIEKSYILK